MRKFGRFVMALGMALVAAALGLFAYNCWEDYTAESRSNAIVDSLWEVIEESDVVSHVYDTEMTEVEIDGYSYIGYVVLPSLNLNLPVMTDWSYAQLKVAPCRYAGSTKTGNLVIAAHNYSSHFGQIRNLAVGDDVYFVDMDGRTWRYEVAALETLAPTDVDYMISSGYELTLYTCTYGGASRVTVRCRAVDPAE